jgi:hypothetical protein
LESRFVKTLEKIINMPEFTTEIDIDPEEFLENCHSRDIKKVLEWLDYGGYLKAPSKESISVAELEYESALDKLHSKWNCLTEDEERTIKNIAKRFF